MIARALLCVVHRPALHFESFVFSRQSVRQCGGVHRQHFRSYRHRPKLRSRLHLHHRPPPHEPRRGVDRHPHPQVGRRPRAKIATPKERLDHEKVTYGGRPTCGPLPQPHHPRAGGSACLKCVPFIATNL